MAWDPLRTDPDTGLEQYSGDTPMDAFGGALGRIAAESMRRLGRRPRVGELADGLAAALAAGDVLDPERAPARLAPLRAAVAAAHPSPRRQRARPGDVVAIPYAGHGRPAVYGWVLAVHGQPSAKRGLSLVVLDRDVAPGDDLAEVVRAPWLLGPMNPGDREIREGQWRIVGHVKGDFAALLPHFACLENRGGQWVRVVRDYLDQEVPGTAENLARVRDDSVGGAGSMPQVIRALRGQGRWVDGYDGWLARGAARP